MMFRMPSRLMVLACAPLIVLGLGNAYALDASAAVAPNGAPAAASDRIAVTVTGQGPDVILIPGLASSGQVWDATVAHLSSTHRVHIVQVAGFAGTPAGSNAAGPVLEPVVEAIHNHIIAHQLTGVAVIGHSLGGTIAMRLAIAHPGDAGRLMIVDALPYAGMMFGPQLTVPMIQPQATMMRDQIVSGTQEAFAQAEPAQMARLIRSRNAEAQAAVQAAVSSDHRVVGQALYDDLVTDMRPDLSKIQVPVTILYPWDDSAGVPQTVTDSLYKGAFARLPQAKVERIDGSAHFIMIDQPQLFRQQVDAFLLR